MVGNWIDGSPLSKEWMGMNKEGLDGNGLFVMLVNDVTLFFLIPTRPDMIPLFYLLWPESTREYVTTQRSCDVS